MTPEQRKKYLAAVARLKRRLPGLSRVRYYQLARERIGICVDCDKPAAIIIAKRCEAHLDHDAKRTAKSRRRKR